MTEALLTRAVAVLQDLIDVTPTFRNPDGQLACSYCGMICEGAVEEDDFDDEGLREGEADCPWVRAKIFLLEELKPHA